MNCWINISKGKLPAKKSVNCAVSLPKRKCRSTCKRTAPLFAYLNREATSMAEPTEEKSVTTESAKEVPAQRKPFRLYRTFYAVSGIAAGLLLLLGIAKIIFPLSGVPENYVVIDGQRYTDEKLVEAKALEALQNASFTDEDLSNLLFQH